MAHGVRDRVDVVVVAGVDTEACYARAVAFDVAGCSLLGNLGGTLGFSSGQRTFDWTRASGFVDGT